MSVRPYRSVSTNTWYDCVRFICLADAKTFADRAALKGHCVDIMSDDDRDTMRLVYTADGNHSGKGMRGTYAR